MTVEEKIKEILKPTNTFVLNSLYIEDGYGCIEAYKNCLIVQPQTVEAERNITNNPYARYLRCKNYFFALVYFPNDLQDREKLPYKYQTRLANLQKAEKLGKVKLFSRLCIPVKHLLNLKYFAKPYTKREEYNYKDDEEDTSFKNLAKEPKNYATIEKVSLTYNTPIILCNAKEYKNKVLFNNFKNVRQFYNMCIINYILEHAKITAPDTLLYNPITEVHMPAKELKKLFPNRTHKISKKDIEISYTREGKRASKNDTAIIKFDVRFIDYFKRILLKENVNIDYPYSFVGIPMFFPLEALKKENLGSNGFKFLLWLLPFFRMKNPRITHSIRTIIKETGMDTRHGYKKPLALLEKYFDYLYRVNMLIEVYEPLKFDIKNLDEPPKYRGHLIRLTKPKKPKNRD